MSLVLLFNQDPPDDNDVYVSLTMSQTVASSAQSNAGASISLSHISTMSDGGQSSAGASMTLSQIASVADGGQSVANASIDVAQIVNLLLNGQFGVESAILLSNIMSVSDSGSSMANASVTIDQIVSTVVSRLSTVEASAEVSNVLNISSNANAIIDASLTLAQIFAIAQCVPVRYITNTGANLRVWVLLKDIVDAGYSVADIQDLMSKVKPAGVGLIVTPYGQIVSGQTSTMSDTYTFDLVKIVESAGGMSDDHYKQWGASYTKDESINTIDDSNYYHYVDTTYVDSLNIVA